MFTAIFSSDKESGFTLVEIMIVVAIIAMMAALAVPTMIGIMPRIRLNNSAMILSNQIAVARLRAISKSSQFRIQFSPGSDSYTLQRYAMTGLGPPATWEWRGLGTTTLKGTDLKSVSGFQIGGVPTNTMVASQMGEINILLGQKAYIVLQEPPVPPATEGTTQKRITVEPTGRMKVERRRDGGTWGED